LEHDSGPAGTADFDRIYREQRRAVERHLVYLTGDRALAEDLAQETFGRLYERGLAPDEPALRNPRGWLLTVASNLAYNHFRSESRRAAREEAALPATTGGDPSDLDAVLDVRAALGTLDARDRTVLMLRHTGFSYAKIAEAVGLAPSSVGTILARAQGRFRSAYEDIPSSARDKE
jgi:RNA polymerase sigma-70 factor (ECF subfamily)